MTPIVIAALATFNLVCAGLDTSGTPDPNSYSKGIIQKTFTEIYRVNLNSGRWCKDDCLSTQSLFAVSDTQIQFQAEESAGGAEYSFAKREDGFFRHTQKIGDWISIREGKCQRAAFSGFPINKF